MSRVLLLASGAAAFVLLGTANAGGYRYGVSDQAFYIPAAVLAADPTAYPRDAPLVEAEAELLVADELFGTIVETTGAELPALFLAGYLVTMLLLAAAATALARGLGLSWMATGAALLLLTFRHRIPRTGANSLEGYLHPRMLAFALGVAALAALVRGRAGWAAVAVAAAAVTHPTTGFWFGLVVAAALGVDRPRWRRPLAGAALAGAAAAAWAVTVGPLAGRLAVMDEAWLAVLAGKDYLFPTEWPLYAWLLNLLYPVVIAAIYRQRRATGAATAVEAALVTALVSLTAVFLATVPLTAMRVALAVQVQATRVFWLLDFATAIYIAWWLVGRRGHGQVDDASSARRAVSVWRPALIVSVLLAASAGRGAYILTVEAPERELFAVSLAPTPWHDVAAWLRTQPGDWHVAADPGHAWRYGTSVRVSARRDTLVESIKDSAIAMYDRRVATRVAGRLQAIGDYASLSAADFRRLDAAYDLDVAVVEASRAVDLPMLYRNTQFVVHDLR